MKLFLARYRGTKVHSSKSVKDNFKLGYVQRYRGTQLEFPCYFTDLLEFLLKIDQGTGGTQVQSPKSARDETFFGQVQRYKGTQLKICERQFQIGLCTEVQRYTARISLLFH